MGGFGSCLRTVTSVLFVGLLIGMASVSHAAQTSPRNHGILGQSASASAAATVPNGFQDNIVFSGLTQPTVVRFSPDGRIFVAQKNGVILVYDGLSDPTAAVFADLSAEVDNYWDRGLLGLALDPNFPTTPYVYVLYTYDAPIGGSAPVWNDACPTPPGPTTDGCVVSGRLSRLTLGANDTMVPGSEQVFINDWCQQFPSHSIGSLQFGTDGMLYVSGGDGASFGNADYGQFGGSPGSPTQKNPCGDPPAGVGGTETTPTGEGGALRSQDLRTSSDPTGLNGAVLRLDPSTGAAAPGNPNIGSSDQNARRIVAEGLRNPFRFTIRPGTNEVWVGDVGWNTWEEIDRIPSPTAFNNFGWPCYEGNGREPEYDNLNVNICENLYSAGTGAVVSPYFTYNHSAQVVPGESCPTSNGSSISGLAFYTGGSYPSAYTGALFVADYTRKCIWVMFRGANGQPDPSTVQTFDAGAAGPVELQIGPGGDLFYVDYDTGTIRRIQYGAQPPPSCPSGQFSAQYFANISLSGTPDLTACETSLDHDWGTGGPGAPIPNDNFSARWTGTFTFPGGATTFTAAANDGIRVWVDGTLLIDGWVDEPTTTYTATVTLTAGAHDVKVEYYEHAGDAVARVSWASGSGGSCASGQFTAQYFPNTTSFSGTPALTTCESTINHDWGTAGPGAPIPNDDFSVRWTGTFTFPAGSTTFTATADDGIRVWVDGTLIIDHWVDEAATTYTVARTLTAGAHVVKVEYYEGLGDAVAIVSWPTGPPNSQPTAFIDTPASSLTWKVGDPISFTGHATDPEQGTLPASALSWTLAIEHCPTGQGCHEHIVQTWSGVASGSFSAPDHEYPSYLQLRLTATDSGGLTNTASVNLNPTTVDLTFTSSPSGLQLTAGSTTATTPFTKTVIQGSANTLSAPAPQTLSGTSYAFSSWSDDGAQTHTVVADTAKTYTATYQATTSADLSVTKSDSPDPVQVAQTLTYTIGVHNNGPDAASAVTLTDTLPTGVTLGTVTPSQGSCSGTATITCALGTLANGASATMTITVTPTVANPTLTNTASVSSSTSDPTAGNNSATATTAVQAPPPVQADLRLTKSGSKSGSTATWTLNVTNLGPNAAQSVVITDTLPSRLAFVSAPGCSYSSSTRVVTCAVSSLANGANAAFTLTTTITGSGGGWITNTAQVTSATTDPNSANNSASAQVRAR